MNERLHLSFQDLPQVPGSPVSSEVLLLSDSPDLHICQGDDVCWEVDSSDLPSQVVRLGNVVAETQVLRGRAFLVRLSHIPLVPELGSFFVMRRAVESSSSHNAVA